MARRMLGEQRAIHRSRNHLSDIFTWVTIAFGALGGGMMFVWAYTLAFSVTQGPTTRNPTLTSLAWSITWGAIAALGMVSALIPGLILWVRPALLGPNWGLPLDRHWPRLAGLARLWEGLVVTTIGVFLALYPLDLTASPPHVNGWSIIAVFAVVFGPLFGLMLVEFLVRRVRHRAP